MNEILRRRLRWILPAINVPLALVLIVTGDIRQMTRPPEALPEVLFCKALNAPATVVAKIVEVVVDRGVFVHFSMSEGWIRAQVLIDLAIFLALVGALWYIVGREIEGQRENPFFSSRALRVPADLFLVSLGVFFGTLTMLTRSSAVRSPLFAILWLAWAAVLVIFYGRDLLRCMRPRPGGAS